VTQIPNMLTVSRILLTPVFAVFFFSAPAWGLAAALAVAVVAQITDWLDGFLARRHNQVSNFGKLADPLADCVFNLTVFACFCAAGLIPAWMLAVVLGRELLMHGYLRPAAARRGVAMGAKIAGKAKTSVQCVVIDGGLVLLLAHARGGKPDPKPFLFWGMAVVVALTVGSLYGYVRELAALRRGR
jgi:CDP-diacylglycerol--glycerol-3-phosphate 3-phosphatidyltransferase